VRIDEPRTDHSVARVYSLAGSGVREVADFGNAPTAHPDVSTPTRRTSAIDDDPPAEYQVERH
jgi:hypothetical protein